jgi:hypothetical protein
MFWPTFSLAPGAFAIQAAMIGDDPGIRVPWIIVY